MNERRLEVADVFRLHADDFLTQWAHVSIADIRNCRTAAMGGHVEQCDRCGQRVIPYNSCRNRNLSQMPGRGARRMARRTGG
jgi:hypothetical protein